MEKCEDRDDMSVGEIKKLIIQTAIEIIEEKNSDSVSMLEIAKLMRISPEIPFHHFQTKDELMKAVGETFASELFIRLKTVFSDSLALSSVERLNAHAYVFLNWGLDHPAHFYMIHSRSVKRVEPLQVMSKIRDLFQALVENTKDISEEDQESHSIQGSHCQSMLLGLLSLYYKGHIKTSSPNRDDALEALSHAWSDFVKRWAK